jgi:hypothetical protein
MTDQPLHSLTSFRGLNGLIHEPISAIWDLQNLEEMFFEPKRDEAVCKHLRQINQSV